MRADHLRMERYCRLCFGEYGRLTYATHVDHIEPHRGNEQAFFEPRNLQSLCAHHHNQKTGTETRDRVGGQKLQKFSPPESAGVPPRARPRNYVNQND